MKTSGQQRSVLRLLQGVLAHFRQHQDLPLSSLRALSWLIYRELDENIQSVDAYLALAYIFCLTGEWERGGQILSHAERVMPREPRIQYMLHQIRDYLDSLSGPQLNVAAVSFGAPSQTETQASSSLPRLEEVQALLQDYTPSQDTARRFKAIRPVLASLAERIHKGHEDV